MGTKWDEIDELLKDASVQRYKGDLAATDDLITAIRKLVAILRRLDKGYGECDQRAEWKLYSRDMMFVSYSCTAHLSLLAGPETDCINSLAINADRDCCYRE